MLTWAYKYWDHWSLVWLDRNSRIETFLCFFLSVYTCFVFLLLTILGLRIVKFPLRHSSSDVLLMSVQYYRGLYGMKLYLQTGLFGHYITYANSSSNVCPFGLIFCIAKLYHNSYNHSYKIIKYLISSLPIPLLFLNWVDTWY